MPALAKVLNPKNLAFLFGLAYLVFGLVSLDHFGISYDEEAQRYNNGGYNYNYITGADKASLIDGNEKYHGPAFEIVLMAIEKAVGFSDVRQVYLMRHLVNFLVFFLSVVVMFFLSRAVFKSDRWGLFAMLLYGLMPRFFAQAHYNSKDIIFLAFLVFSFYSLVRLSKSLNFKWVLLHALITGFMIDVRILGVFMPIASIGFLLFSHILSDQAKAPAISKLTAVIGAYIVLQFAAIIAFWPILWEGPIQHIGGALDEMNRKPGTNYFFWTGDIKYWGNIYKYNEIPWHYLPGWMLVTIPVFYQLLGAIGIVGITAKFSSFKKETLWQYRFDFLFLACFIGLLGAIVIKKPSVYDGWRHMYFLYVPFALVATRGAEIVWRRLKSAVPMQYARVAVAALFFVVFAGPAISMVRYHANQYVYFNALASAFFSPVEENFEMDYWGLGYRQGLEYLLENNEGNVELYVEHSPGYDNRLILDASERKRITYHKNFYKTGIYYLADYRASKNIEPKIKSELVHEFKNPSGTYLWLYKTLDSLHVKNIIYSEENDFESNENFTIYESAPSGERVDMVGGDREYGYTVRKTLDSADVGGSLAVRINAKFMSKVKAPNVSYVVSVDRDGKSIFWGGQGFDFIFQEANEWVEWTLGFDDLGADYAAGDVISVYLLGINEEGVYQDDLKITILSYAEEDFTTEKRLTE